MYRKPLTPLFAVIVLCALTATVQADLVGWWAFDEDVEDQSEKENHRLLLEAASTKKTAARIQRTIRWIANGSGCAIRVEKTSSADSLFEKQRAWKARLL